MLWDYNEKDIEKELSEGGDYIQLSGNYIGTIEIAEIVNSKTSSAQGVSINLTTDEGKCRPVFWFKKADGSVNEFAKGQLNRLMYLCKIKTIETEEVNEKTTIPAFKDKKIGVFLEVKAKNDNSHEYNVKDFFHPQNKKTADENKSGKNAEKYKIWEANFKKSITNNQTEQKPKAATPTQATSAPAEDDEFPF